MYISSLHSRGNIKLIYKIFIIILILVVLSVSAFVHFINVARPFVENKARFIAIDIINLSVGKYVKKNSNMFEEMFSITYGEDGSVKSAVANSKNINIIKSEITTMINNALDSDKEYTARIPLANLIGIGFLSGIGTPISLKMHPVSRVIIDFENSFTSQGINQTHFELLLNVKVSVMVTVPGFRKSVSVTTTIPVGEALFMGEVPENYTNFTSGDGTEVGFDIS